jgi:hypothetical protein
MSTLISDRIAVVKGVDVLGATRFEHLGGFDHTFGGPPDVIRSEPVVDARRAIAVESYPAPGGVPQQRRTE